MSSLSFPDINVWLALTSAEHVHADSAKTWWREESGQIAFSRFTQLGLLRLMTTAAAMDGRPLTMLEAWRVYDRLFEDDRVVFVPETREVDGIFRGQTGQRSASPKVWADAWLLAMCRASGGVLITFDRALAGRGAICLV